MQSLQMEKDLEKSLSRVIFLIRQGVVEQENKKISTLEKIQANLKEFIHGMHKVLKEALEILIEKILFLEEQILTLNKASDKNNLQGNTLKYWKALFESFVTSFVWLAVNYDKFIVKNLYKGPKRGYLKDQNVQLTLKVARSFNEDPNFFCIPLDFTLFSGIGDLLKIDRSDGRFEWSIIELKSGKVNSEILEVLKNNRKKDYANFVDTYGKRGIKQLDRILKQKKLASEALETANLQEGIHVVKGQPRLIYQRDSLREYFHNEINSILLNSSKHELDIIIIDNCLLLAALKVGLKERMVEIDFVIRHKIIHLVNEKCPVCSGEPPENEFFKKIANFDIVNWKNGFFTPTFYPLVHRPISSNNMMDIIFARKELYFYFSAENFLNLCNKNNLKAKFIIGKEYRQMKCKSSSKDFADFGSKFLCFEHEDLTQYMGNGIFFDMIYNWLKPLSLIDELKASTEFFVALSRNS